MRSIDSDADGLLSNGDLKRAFVSTRDVLVTSDGGSLVARVVAARERSLSLVRVAGLSVDSLVLDHVLEGSVHLTALTTLVAIRSAAVNQVLLREFDELLGGHEVDRFHRSGGGE